MLNRIRYRVLLVAAITVSIGLMTTAFYYTRHQEKALLTQHERTIRKLTETITQGLQSVMLAGSAEIAQAYADQLKRVPGLTELRIMRTDGLEAFRDNKTIDDVNLRQGQDMFFPRDDNLEVRVLPENDSDLLQAIQSREAVPRYSKDTDGNGQLVFVAPVLNIDQCYKCHGKSQPVRGLIKLSASLATVERDIYELRLKSLLVLTIALMVTLSIIGYLLGRTVVRPIERISKAMSSVSRGEAHEKIPVVGHDEIGRMAQSFNLMTHQLQQTYRGLQEEQDKLSTVIFSAHEGMVVMDASGQIVLTNPAAEELLGKAKDDIIAAGFMGILDNPVLMDSCLTSGQPEEILFQDRVLQVTVSKISQNDGGLQGTVAMIRNITEEKNLEQELRRLSTTDGLTGLFNRRFLDATLDTEFHRTRRTGNSVSVVMFDIDRFKKFNDTYGHDQGDRVLQMTAQCLRDCVRPFDYPCRYGGEEYVAILPGMKADDALAFAERLRLRIAETEVDSLHVTVSLGVATFPDLKLGKPEELIEAADGALYRSKENGRNQTTVATQAEGAA